MRKMYVFLDPLLVVVASIKLVAKRYKVLHQKLLFSCVTQ